MELKDLTPEQKQEFKNIGLILRKRREELNHSLESIADITRISINTLRALESGDHQEFTTLIFMRGFLRNYCNFLEIESDEYVKTMNQIYTGKDYSDDNLQPKTENKHKLSGRKKNFSFSLGLTLLLILAVGVGGFFFYNYYLFDSSGIQEEGVIQLVGAEKAQETADKPTVSEENSGSSEKPPLSLKLDVLKNGWLRLSKDDEIIEAKLKAGFTYQWDAEKNIQLTLGRGDLATISLNGEIQSIQPENADRLTELSFEAEN